MKKLSIVATFWDGDFEKLSGVYDEIQKNIRIPFELILVDNREKNTAPIEERILKNSIHVKVGYNASCIPGRIFGAEKASGNYVWFVDVDDGIGEVTDETLLDNDADILSFKYNEIQSDSQANELKSQFGKFLFNCGVSVWNKWYKTDVFLQTKEEVIGTGLTFYGEDLIYNYFVFRKNKNYKTVEKNIYYHYASSGSVNGIYNMTQVFDWTKRSGFTEVELEDLHKVYINFIFQSIYFELYTSQGDKKTDTGNAVKKANYFSELLIEAREKNWLEGIIRYNKFSPEKVSPVMKLIEGL